MSDDPTLGAYYQLDWHEHFLGALGGGKNRKAMRAFTAAIAHDEHAHLVGRGWSVCSLVEPCPGSQGYADWWREHN